MTWISPVTIRRERITETISDLRFEIVDLKIAVMPQLENLQSKICN
jgi:hypothetical protein